MKIHDISQEVFGCKVYPGDPSPEKEEIMRIRDGALYNLTGLKMCAHNGTHVDAPYHFIDQGETVDRIALNRFVGFAYVVSREGYLTSDDAESIMAEAEAASARSGFSGCDCCRRILVRGKAVLTEDAAKTLADHGILLFGTESWTVGPEDAPMAVHLILLGRGIVLLEGIRLTEIKDGVYFLNAAPINLGGADGAPCRAWLICPDDLCRSEEGMDD